MKKIICIALAICFVLSLPSCKSNIKMTDEEFTSIISELVPLSYDINKIFWGGNLPLENGDAEPVITVSTAQYYRLSDEFPYKSVAEIKTAAEKVYSPEYLSDVYVMAFDGYEYSDDENEYKLSPRFKDDDEGVLCYDITNTTAYPLSTVIDVSTAKVVSSTYFTVTAEVAYTSGETNGTMKITIRNCADGWRLDSPTY